MSDKYEKAAAELIYERERNAADLAKLAEAVRLGTEQAAQYDIQLRYERERNANNVASKDGEIATLRQELAQSYEAIAHLHEGKPLGELVGRQMIEIMAMKIASLKVELDLEKTANHITENHNHFDCAVAMARKDVEIATLKAEIDRLGDELISANIAASADEILKGRD